MRITALLALATVASAVSYKDKFTNYYEACGYHHDAKWKVDDEAYTKKECAEKCHKKLQCKVFQWDSKDEVCKMARGTDTKKWHLKKKTVDHKAKITCHIKKEHEAVKAAKTLHKHGKKWADKIKKVKKVLKDDWLVVLI